MKLVPAKCPSCGANIEVNESLERAICQFCGNTVLVEDAIKIKVEHSGTIKVAGIKSEEDYIEIVKKYYNVKDYVACINVIEKIFEENPFNAEALVLYLKHKTNVKSLNKDEEVDLWEKINYLIESDKRHKYTKELEQFENTLYNIVFEKNYKLLKKGLYGFTIATNFKNKYECLDTSNFIDEFKKMTLAAENAMRKKCILGFCLVVSIIILLLLFPILLFPLYPLLLVVFPLSIIFNNDSH